MGFLDELNSTPIKTMPDGRRMIFPYGSWGRGYVIPTQQDYDRLQRLIGIYTVVALALGLGAAAVSEFWLLVVAAGLMGFYLLWVRIVLDGMPRTEETITYKEVMAPHVRTYAVVSRSVMLIVCLFLLVDGYRTVVYDRNLAHRRAARHPVLWRGRGGVCVAAREVAQGRVESLTHRTYQTARSNQSCRNLLGSSRSQRSQS